MGVGLGFITSQSLWMDEGSTVFKALFPTPAEWWTITKRLGGSDMQMPIYMFLVWCWEKMGAASEYALRCVNLPWLIIAVLALHRVRFWPLVILTSPFMLYYTGELRPYAMQVAAGSVATLALMRIREGHEARPFAGLATAGFAALLLTASSLTSAIWAVGLGLGIIVMRPGWLKQNGFWLRLSPWLLGLAGFGAFYLMTLLQGYRAASVGEGSILSILFGFYELLGLAGLGPSRGEIRANPASLLTALPLLAPAALVAVAAWIYGAWNWKKNEQPANVVAVAISIIFPLAVFTILSFVADFRVLGRHLSPVLPAVLLPLAACLNATGPRRRIWQSTAAVAVALSLVSALALRFQSRHERDDYRKAASIGIKALQDGKRVWWQADMNATRYYAYRQGGMPMVNAIQVMESDTPPSLLSADMVVINRPDFRFRGVDYQADLKRNFFVKTASFTGFEVWEAK